MDSSLDLEITREANAALTREVKSLRARLAAAERERDEARAARQSPAGSEVAYLQARAVECEHALRDIVYRVDCECSTCRVNERVARAALAGTAAGAASCSDPVHAAAMVELTGLRAQLGAVTAEVAQWREAHDRTDALRDRWVVKCRAAEAERDRLLSEAQIHAQEAATQRSTVREIYQLVTGGRGEPGDWHGAEPVRALVAERDQLRTAIREAAAWARGLARGILDTALGEGEGEP